jgi:hypothetical protein
VVYQDPAHIRTLHTPPLFFDLPTLIRVFFITKYGDSTQEARIILAIEAIRTSKNISRRAAAKIYNIPESTLRLRMNGHTSLRERRPANNKLTELEDEVIVRYILDMDARGFPPRLAGVEDMANYILESRRATRRKALGASICTASTRVKDAFYTCL